ncbi:hypothetical protein HPB48_017096 [Haemaphysalis longicornis]|uniref:Uncharacterized protein n=1 Tax=Haemaphysalis longicornis TaxID=44386 RepID=A0A9J6GGH0_HAELO|nr:hypothetical protein HPB48_017096 [Haemaphysalis longicornis]
MSLKNPFLFLIQALTLASSSRPTEHVCGAILLEAKPVGRCDSHEAAPGDSCNGYGPLGMRCWIPSLAAQHTAPRITSPVITAINSHASSIRASGHGGSSASMSLKNPFLFLIQVRESSKVACYRSDDVFLLLLPCPRPLVLAFCATYDCFADLLSSCGDFESNPGPAVEEMLKTIMNQLGELKENPVKVNQRFDETCSMLTVINNKLDELTQTVKSYTAKVDDLQEQVNGLIRKIGDLKNRSRRNNIIIFGVKKPVGEPQQSLEEQVTKNIFEDLLKISAVAIERIHRIGRPAENKCRPVILKLVDGRDKVKIFKNCCNLKGTKYSISEDFSPRVQAIRKKLWASAKAERESGVKVALLFDKIKINGKLHQWDELLNKRVPLSAP